MQVEFILSEFKGISQILVDTDATTAQFVAQDSVDFEPIKKALDEAGFPVEKDLSEGAWDSEAKDRDKESVEHEKADSGDKDGGTEQEMK